MHLIRRARQLHMRKSFLLGSFGVLTVVLSSLVFFVFVLQQNAYGVVSCGEVSGCPTGDASVGSVWYGMQPDDLNSSFRFQVTGSDGYSCSYPGGAARNSAFCPPPW